VSEKCTILTKRRFVNKPAIFQQRIDNLNW